MFGRKKEFTEEQRIRQRMIDQAVALADEAYKRDAAIRRLRMQDLTSTILQDLVNAAYYDLKVTVTLSDKTQLTFERTDVQQQLNTLESRF
jgi:hypothetical protein